jgi:hypothetical protein
MMTPEQVRAVLETLSPTQEKVDFAIRTAVEAVQPSRVIIFGSWARGEAKWDSDVDLAVVMPQFGGSAVGTDPSSVTHPAFRSSDEHRSRDGNRGTPCAVPQFRELDLLQNP